MRAKFWKTEVGMINSYLVEAFGDLRGDERNNVPCPPPGVLFEVLEPIETCHPCCGLGLEKINRHNCLPEGQYKVVSWENDRGSHKLYLEDQSGERVWCFYGSDMDGSCMDWRVVKKVA